MPKKVRQFEKQKENREQIIRTSLENKKQNSNSVFQWQQKLFEQDVDKTTLIQSVIILTCPINLILIG